MTPSAASPRELHSSASVMAMRSAAPEDRLDPCGELLRAEGLTDVVVGPCREASLDVLFLRPRSEQDHGKPARSRVGPQASRQLVAVYPRHHHVEHGQI